MHPVAKVVFLRNPGVEPIRYADRRLERIVRTLKTNAPDVAFLTDPDVRTVQRTDRPGIFADPAPRAQAL